MMTMTMIMNLNQQNQKSKASLLIRKYRKPRQSNKGCGDSVSSSEEEHAMFTI